MPVPPMGPGDGAANEPTETATATATNPLPRFSSGATVTLMTAPVSMIAPRPPPAPRSSSALITHPLPSSRSAVSPLPTRLGTPRSGSPLPPPPVPIPIPRLEDEDNVLDGDDLLEDDDYEDTTAASTEPVIRSQQPRSAEDPTSPTLSLANRSDSSREVYRLFLASEYAPALELANELIAQGDDDPMLITIARECRASLANTSTNSAQTPSSLPPASDDDANNVIPPSLHTLVDGNTTLAELAAMSGMSLDQMLRILDRLVATGVLAVTRSSSFNR